MSIKAKKRYLWFHFYSQFIPRANGFRNTLDSVFGDRHCELKNWIEYRFKSRGHRLRLLPHFSVPRASRVDANAWRFNFKIGKPYARHNSSYSGIINRFWPKIFQGGLSLVSRPISNINLVWKVTNYICCQLNNDKSYNINDLSFNINCKRKHQICIFFVGVAC